MRRDHDGLEPRILGQASASAEGKGAYAVVFDTMALPAAAGFALGFARRARSLVVAGIGLAALALLSREPRLS